MAEVISAGEFRNGLTIEFEGDVYTVIEFQHVKPGKGAAFVRTTLKSVKGGGTALFAMMALFGDVGASAGPTLVGFASGAFGDDLQKGLVFGIVFPVLLLIGIILIGRMRGKETKPLGKIK